MFEAVPSPWRKVIDDSEADALLRKKYRDGWTLDG